MTAAQRAARTAEADKLVQSAYDGSGGGPDAGAAVVAVGGYGRGELAPHSDLDLVLVHDDGVDLGDLAERLWYPLWDTNLRLDHAVRAFGQTVDQAAADLKVALGVLDVRHVAGDPNLTLRLRTTLLSAWRRDARRRLPELGEMVRRRHALTGELAHASVPDLKESLGGLRDATVLKALVASWLVDVPHGPLEHSRQALLDIRDALQEASGRATDRIGPELWAELGLGPEREAQRVVREHGRRIAHIWHSTWRRVQSLLDAPPRTSAVRRPHLTPLAPGVARSGDEVVLDRTAQPGADPLLMLRAAAEAAERDLLLAPATAARLARETAPLGDPWPSGARALMVRLLAAGDGLRGVWETLEETGGLDALLPEWQRLRSLPHASVIHRFTVDRHVLETCVEASRLIRSVSRPDVLVVAALLHDIGKGGLTEHSVAGEPIARAIATRMGFCAEEVDLIALLVRWHLLLAEVATSRDPDDPATLAAVLDHVPSAEGIELLAALTEADARATAPQAWSPWRANLVRQLAARCLAAVGAPAEPAMTAPPRVAIPKRVRKSPQAVEVGVEPSADGARVTVVSRDRIGMLADAAAMLALGRTSVLAARAWVQDDYAVSTWDVADDHLDEAVLRQRLEAISEGRLDARGRLSRPRPARLRPTVAIRPEASASATVLEVRMDDRPGVVHLVAATLADLHISVRSAHVSTLGPQAIDVFYVQEEYAGALGEQRAAEAAHAVRAALDATVTAVG